MHRRPGALRPAAADGLHGDHGGSEPEPGAHGHHQGPLRRDDRHDQHRRRLDHSKIGSLGPGFRPARKNDRRISVGLCQLLGGPDFGNRGFHRLARAGVSEQASLGERGEVGCGKDRRLERDRTAKQCVGQGDPGFAGLGEVGDQDQAAGRGPCDEAASLDSGRSRGRRNDPRPGAQAGFVEGVLDPHFKQWLEGHRPTPSGGR